MADREDLVGQILLGKLEVVRLLGGGGMGLVYEVEHRLTGHRRALKVVHAKFADRPRFMKRLLREAKVAGTLGSRYVVETYDAGRLEDGSAYVLMELLHGQSLYEAMQDVDRLSPRRVASIMSQVAEGMVVAHAAGIVHRDLKPENIFLVEEDDGEESVKILDFGVSKFEPTHGEAPTRLTAEGTLVGTPYYMSPEQAGAKTVDARTDVYAMGVIMYETLTGRLPFEADSVGELFVKIGAGECVPLDLRRPDLDPRWPSIVHRAFHRDPERRHPSAEALRRDLLPLLAGGATAARAKTISDGARATLGFDEPLPPPPKAPAEAGGASMDETSAELSQGDREPSGDDEHDASALSAPPAAPDSTGGALPAWGWAVIGAAAVLALVIPWQLGRSDPEPSEVASRTAAPPAANAAATADEASSAGAPPEHAAAEQTPLAPDAGAARIEEAARLEEAARREPATPAGAAGLDPNPYR